MITIEVHDQDVLAAFNRLQAAAVNPGPALRLIGERLTETSKRRFATSTAPDGSRWAPNSRATLEALLSRGSGQFSAFSDIASRKQKLTRTGTKKGYFLKDGRLGAKGRDLLSGKKPLIGESKALSTTIDYRVDATGVTIFSPMEYSAMQQFGGTKDSFPNLWGNIPARPFLGVSAADKDEILEILREALLGAAGRG